jgi:hypothetical protein
VDERELRRRCEEILDQVDATAAVDVFDFCRTLGEQRARPLHLVSLSLPPDAPCGLFVSTARFDLICYQQDTNRVHQQHIVAHEVGHLLCRHEAAPVLDQRATRLLFPHLDPAVIQRMLGRAAYDAVEEREAEVIASLLRARWLATPAPERHPPAADAEVLARLENSLGRRPRPPKRP